MVAMLNALVKPKFCLKEPSEELQKKLTLSLSECENQEFKEIRCGYCNFPIAVVSLSTTGILWVKCQKCKAEFPINPAYFYRTKGYRRATPFIISFSTTE